MENETVRKVTRENKVPLWKIAQELGISEATMTRRMRNELPAADQEKLVTVIGDLSAGAESKGKEKQL